MAQKTVPEAKLQRLTMKDSSGTTSNPLVPFYKPKAVPPAYYDDKFPAHRTESGTYFLRIGDCQFFIPPLFINVTNNSPTQRIPVIRQRESTNIKRGYSHNEITMTLWFNDLEQINGTPMEGPGKKTYYMDGLRSLIAQFKRAPFTPIVNEFLNSVYGIYAVTLLSITVNTVPDFPECLQATLVMKEFNAMPFTGMPSAAFERIYCWPIFRWYYQQMILDDDKTFARTRLPKIATTNFSGEIRFKVIPEKILNSDLGSASDRYNYMDHDYIWMDEVPMDYSDFTVDSINIAVGNIVTDLQLALYRTPTHQYLGSLDTMIEINMTTQSRKVLSQFVALEQTLEDYSRNYKERITCGYLGVDNELVRMFGVETATIQNLTIETVQGYPDLFSIRMSLLSYNKTQKDQETPDSMSPFSLLGEAKKVVEKYGLTSKGADDYKNPIIQDAVIEDLISEMELYPDLELPSYGVLKNAVSEINTFRKANGLTDIGITADDLQSPIVKQQTVVVKEAVHENKKNRNAVTPWDGHTYVPGNSSWNVTVIQNNLVSKGYLSSASGTFDSNTSAAVKKIQADYHLIVTGVVDLETWNAIVNMNVDPRVKYQDTNFGMESWAVSSGQYVGEIQKALKALGFYGGAINNTFDSTTKSATIAFQHSTGFLGEDGVVGINTWGELFTRFLQIDTPPVTETKTYDAGLYVDPDFYVFYPTPVALEIMDEDTFAKSLGNAKTSAAKGMLDKSLIGASDKDAKTAIDSVMQMMTQAHMFGAEYGVPATNIEKGIVDVPPIELKEHYKLMFHDMYANNKRYTLCRAFPTVCFVFVDEGMRVRGTRMWSNYYTYHSVVSASIVREKDNPVDVCEIVLSNVYHSLDTQQQFGPVAEKSFFEQLFLGIDKQMIEARLKTYDYMAIKPGCRLHLRMGYGSTPQLLNTVFNGMAASVDVGEVITIIGQSDGVELISPMTGVDPDDHNGIFALGREPSNIIRKIMIERDGWMGAFHWRSMPWLERFLMPTTTSSSTIKTTTSTTVVTADSVKVIDHTWDFGGSLVYDNAPSYVVLHHAAASQATPEEIDQWHKDKGWKGIGYQYYVRKDGSIHRGRPDNAQGSHCKAQNMNHQSIGICAEGNFDGEAKMLDVQRNAIVALTASMCKKYNIPTKNIIGHGDAEAGNSCPGAYYPKAQIIQEVGQALSSGITSTTTTVAASNTEGKEGGVLAGFSNGSKYGIEHFGYVYSQAKNSGGSTWENITETIRLSMKAIFGIGDQGTFCYDAVKNVYKGAPFYDRPTTDIDKEHWLHELAGKDEDYVGFYMYGKSPWDVFQFLANSACDYIITASPHQFRSTIFYGQPHWLYKYGFRYVGTNSAEERVKLENYFELVKTYCQVHLIDSYNDIIDNGVRASSEGVITNVIPVFTTGETLNSDLIIFADKNIYPEYQRTAYYDTTAMQDYFLYEGFWTKIMKVKTAERAARIMGVSYLQHSFRDMYKGEMVLLGDASIKPHDIIYISDVYSKVFGPASVGKVVHEISIENGFTTSVKPDMITVGKDPGSVYLSRTIGAIQLVCFNLFTSKMALHSAMSLVKAEEMFRATAIAEKVEKYEKIATKVELGTAATIIGMGVLATGGLGFVTAFLALGAWIAIDSLAEWLIKVATGRDEHGIACIPLYHKDKPMIAGMKGYKTLLPYQPDPDMGDDTNEVYGKETDFKARDALREMRNAEYAAIKNGQFERRNNGVDIFNLSLDFHMSSSYYASGGTGGYGTGGYDESSKWLWPFPNHKTISSPYGNRICPTHGPEFHTGMDIDGLQGGDPIVAARSGTVEIPAFDANGYGNYVIVTHANGFSTLYAHMSSISVSNGATIAIGDQIGICGTTGSSTGPHLHFEIRQNGQHTNPASYSYVDNKSELEIKIDSTAVVSTTNPNEFFKLIAPIAKAMYQKYHIFASVQMANMAQESGYGTSPLARRSLNFGGVKVGSESEPHDPVPPLDGGWFKKFNSVEEYMEHQAKMLATSSYYGPIRNASTPTDSLDAFSETEYCGHSQSKDNEMLSIWHDYNLAQYD